MPLTLFLYGLVGLSSISFGGEIEPIEIKSTKVIGVEPRQWGVSNNVLRIFCKRENQDAFYALHACILNESGETIATFSNFAKYSEQFGPAQGHYPVGPFFDDERYFIVTGFGDIRRLQITDVHNREFYIKDVQHTHQPEELLNIPCATLSMYGETIMLENKRIPKTEIYDQEIIQSMRNALWKKRPLIITLIKENFLEVVKIFEYKNMAAPQWYGWRPIIIEDALGLPHKSNTLVDPLRITIDLNKNERDGLIYRRNKSIYKFIVSIGLFAAIIWSVKELCDSLKEIKL